MPQRYNIQMPNLFDEYQKGVDRARADRAYEAEQRRNAFLSSAFRQYTDPMTGELDRNALLGAVSQAGYGPESLKLTKEFQDLEKARIANFESELKNQRLALAGVLDQGTYTAWRNQFVRRMPELAGSVPEAYSPETQRRLMLEADKYFQQTYTSTDTGAEIVGRAFDTFGPGQRETYREKVTMSPYQQAQLDIQRRQAAERPGPTLQKGGAVLLEDGSVVNTIFDPASGTFFYETPQGRMPVPPTARPATASVGAPLTGQQLITRRGELADEVKGIRALDNYFKTVDSIDQGVGLIADKLSANAKTFFDKDISEKELATLDSNAQLQRLLGLLRESVVGPGVMTEYDAQRVIMALGGNFGALRNKQVVKKIIGDLIDEKRRRVATMQQELAYSERVFGLSPIELPELEEEAESTDLGKLSDEELLRRLGQ